MFFVKNMACPPLFQNQSNFQHLLIFVLKKNNDNQIIFKVKKIFKNSYTLKYN